MDEDSDDIRLSHVEQLTKQFFDWEIRGRGWKLWPYPVNLEPPFRPFWFHSVERRPSIDDARKPTILSNLGKRFASFFVGPTAPDYSRRLVETEEESAPEPFANEDDIIEIVVSLPPSEIIDKNAAEQFILSSQQAGAPLGFEIIARHDSVSFQLSCRKTDLPFVRHQLHGYFPEAVIREKSGNLQSAWSVMSESEVALVDFGLSREFMLPLRTYRTFEVDPLIGIVAAMSELHEGEFALLQILVQGATAPWSESVFRAVTDGTGDPFFIDAPDMVRLAKQKLSRPLFAVALRVAVQGLDAERAWQTAKAVGTSLTQFVDPAGNELLALTNDGYPPGVHLDDIFLRRSHRGGMLLNVDELASIVHLPSDSVQTEKLERKIQKTRAAPAIAAGHDLLLGENSHNGKMVPVTLNAEQRSRHMYVIGASGTGKSTLLLNLIIQDIENGNGVGVLDPHGDLIDHILSRIPDHRINDVILLDPSDDEYPIGFNFLTAHSELEKTLLASDLVSVFRRLSTTWGDQMTSVLGNAILAFLESSDGGTLADLRRFLVEPEYRRQFLPTVQDNEIIYYWTHEFPLLAGRPQAPLLTRLDTFLRPKTIRHMVGQRKNCLDFRSIMDDKKIFLCKLAQGAIGEENSYLLGTVIVSKLHQMALGRQQTAESLRQPFYLYIDEFQHFITPSMAAILSGARKFRLSLVLAHQELRQLSNQDSDVAHSVIANPYTRICFRLGDSDAQKLRDGFSSFDAKDLQSLGTGEAIMRMERAEYDFNLKTSLHPVIDAEIARQKTALLVSLSRQRYARPRHEVEAELASSRSADLSCSNGKGSSKRPSSKRFSSEAIREGLDEVHRQSRPPKDKPPGNGNSNGH